jgi:hypothetical protein
VIRPFAAALRCGSGSRCQAPSVKLLVPHLVPKSRLGLTSLVVDITISLVSNRPGQLSEAVPGWPRRQPGFQIVISGSHFDAFTGGTGIRTT